MGISGVRGCGGGKMETTVLEQQQKKDRNKVLKNMFRVIKPIIIHIYLPKETLI